MTHQIERFDDEIRRTARGRSPLPSAGFEERLMDVVRTRSMAAERPPRGRLVAVGSAALAMLVVTVLLGTSPSFRARLTPTPAQPVASTDPGARATFVYTHSSIVPIDLRTTGAPPTPAPLLRADWTGAARGSLALPQGVSAGSIALSPDGRYAMARADHGVRILDDAGNVVATDSSLSDTWAGDSRHLCRLDQEGGQAAVQVATIVPGHGITHSTVRISGLTRSDALLGSYQLLGCSIAQDRAVLIRHAGVAPQGQIEYAVDVVQLSTGRLTPLPLPNGGWSLPVLSLDGRRLAVTDFGVSTSPGPRLPARFPDGTIAPAVQQQSPAPQEAAMSSAVIDVDTGQVLARLPGAAVAFTGDGLRAVLDIGTSLSVDSVSVVDWQTGRVTWSMSGGSVDIENSVRPLPGGEDLALDLHENRGAEDDVVLVRASGRVVTIARSSELLAQLSFSLPA